MKIGVITQNGCFQRLFAYLGGKKPIIRGQTVNFLAEFCINAKKKTYTNTNFFKKAHELKLTSDVFWECSIKTWAYSPIAISVVTSKCLLTLYKTFNRHLYYITGTECSDENNILRNGC